jgi:hypothetical protein
MTAITVDEAVQACLGSLTQQTELRDSGGRLLGIFTPCADATARIYEEAKARFNPEVIEQRAASDGPWLSTAEVLQRLRSLEPTE